MAIWGNSNIPEQNIDFGNLEWGYPCKGLKTDLTELRNNKKENLSFRKRERRLFIYYFYSFEIGILIYLTNAPSLMNGHNFYGQKVAKMSLKLNSGWKNAHLKAYNFSEVCPPHVILVLVCFLCS